jgi:predicted nucleic acid-binding protein
MILLDANILSELMRPLPEKGLEEWLADRLWCNLWSALSSSPRVS